MFAVWPLPALEDGRKPEVSSPFSQKRPSGAIHDGVDILYRANNATDPPAAKPNASGKVPYTSDRSKLYYSGPVGVAIMSVADGVVVGSNDKKAIGGDVWVHHPQLVGPGAPQGLVTRYAHLASRDVKEGQKVKAGQRLGTMGHGTVILRHLHFGVVPAGKKGQWINPAPMLAGAGVLPWPGGAAEDDEPNDAAPHPAATAVLPSVPDSPPRSLGRNGPRATNTRPIEKRASTWGIGLLLLILVGGATYTRR